MHTVTGQEATVVTPEGQKWIDCTYKMYFFIIFFHKSRDFAC